MSKNLEHNELIARWLSGDLTSEEKKELDDSAELDALKVVLDDVSTWSVEKFDVEKGLSELKTNQTKQTEQTKQPQAKIIQWNNVFKIAAVITLLLVAYFNKDTILGNGKVELVTGIGEVLVHQLPDGSVVTIDAVSSLSYVKDNWNENRSLNLEGQAYFEVEKGMTFTVSTLQGNVEVLGTKFNVKASRKEFFVQCYEGKVKVVAGSQEKILVVNESTILVKGKLISSPIRLESPDWILGYNEYNKALLSYVVHDLKKYYNVKIKLPSKYANLIYSGKVSNDNLKNALETIFIPMEIPYTLNGGNSVVFD